MTPPHRTVGNINATVVNIVAVNVIPVKVVVAAERMADTILSVGARRP